MSHQFFYPILAPIGCQKQVALWIFQTFPFQGLWWRCFQSSHLWNNAIGGFFCLNMISNHMVFFVYVLHLIIEIWVLVQLYYRSFVNQKRSWSVVLQESNFYIHLMEFPTIMSCQGKECPDGSQFYCGGKLSL